MSNKCICDHSSHTLLVLGAQAFAQGLAHNVHSMNTLCMVTGWQVTPGNGKI